MRRNRDCMEVRGAPLENILLEKSRGVQFCHRGNQARGLLNKANLAAVKLACKPKRGQRILDNDRRDLTTKRQPGGICGSKKMTGDSRQATSLAGAAPSLKKKEAERTGRGEGLPKEAETARCGQIEERAPSNFKSRMAEGATPHLTREKLQLAQAQRKKRTTRNFTFNQSKRRRIALCKGCWGSRVWGERADTRSANIETLEPSECRDLGLKNGKVRRGVDVGLQPGS